MALDVTEVRLSLFERLSRRRREIECTTTTRVLAISDPAEVCDSTYAEGLRAAIKAALDYGISGIKSDEDHPSSVPASLLAQARLAARNQVSLATVFRRYFAGYSLLVDLIAEDASMGELAGVSLRSVLRRQATLFDRLLVAVGDEYAREKGPRRSREQQRADRVRRILAGEFADSAKLEYEIDSWHLGVIALGGSGMPLLRKMAKVLDRRILLVQPDDRDTTWGWFGGQSELSSIEVCNLVDPLQEAGGGIISVGESGQGIDGWRLTHRQAQAALPIAMRRRQGVTRYAQVALLAAALRDDVLATSLQSLYIDPLSRAGSDGAMLIETLAAYFSAGRNASSSAAALRVSRQTVSLRLKEVEERVGQPLGGCAAEIETALRLQGCL